VQTGQSQENQGLNWDKLRCKLGANWGQTKNSGKLLHTKAQFVHPKFKTSKPNQLIHFSLSSLSSLFHFIPPPPFLPDQSRQLFLLFKLQFFSISRFFFSLSLFIYLSLNPKTTCKERKKIRLKTKKIAEFWQVK